MEVRILSYLILSHLFYSRGHEFDSQTSQTHFPVFEICARDVASTLAPLVEVRSRHTSLFITKLGLQNVCIHAMPVTEECESQVVVYADRICLLPLTCPIIHKQVINTWNLTSTHHTYKENATFLAHKLTCINIITVRRGEVFEQGVPAAVCGGGEHRHQLHLPRRSSGFPRLEEILELLRKGERKLKSETAVSAKCVRVTFTYYPGSLFHFNFTLL